jgi:hypothetical protein
MKKRCVTLVAVLLPAFSLAQNPTASIQGMVIDRVTSKGIAEARLLLTGIVQDRVVNLAGKTDAAGEFRFEKVPPSAGYWLLASHGEEHLQTTYQQRGLYGLGEQIPVATGQKIVDLRLTMVPTGEISGRVIDAEGKPVLRASVSVMRPYYRQGVGELFPVAEPVATNKQGEYQIKGVPPGALYIRVGTLNSTVREFSALNFIPGMQPAESEDYPLTYFPGTPDEQNAKAVNLHAGERLAGVDVILSKVRTRRVRGSVVDERGGRASRPVVLMLIRRNAQPESRPGKTVESADGNFDFRNVLPGSYFVVAKATNGQMRLDGRVQVDVGSQDVSGITVRLTPGFDVGGSISLEGGGAIDRGPVSVALRPMPPASSLGSPTSPPPTVSGGSFRSVEIGLVQIVELPVVQSAVSNGTLTFRGVRPWRYSVEVSHGYPDHYVKSIQLGGVDVSATGVNLDSPSAAQLDIVLRAPAGKIVGQVLDSRRKPAAALRVLLLPGGDLRERRDLYRVVWTDGEGRFQLGSLAPGDYEVFAWEFVEEDAWLDQNFLRLYEGKGVPVHIDEGTQKDVSLQTIAPWF